MGSIPPDLPRYYMRMYTWATPPWNSLFIRSNFIVGKCHLCLRHCKATQVELYDYSWRSDPIFAWDIISCNTQSSLWYICTPGQGIVGCCAQFCPRRLELESILHWVSALLDEVRVVYAIGYQSALPLHYGPSTGNKNPPIPISAYWPVYPCMKGYNELTAIYWLPYMMTSCHPCTCV